MITFPNCKINLGLNITAKREDGYHDIETVFYPLQLQDALEVIKTGGNEATDVSFTSTGLPIAGNPSENLCVKAYQLLKKDHPDLPPVYIHLHKAIPMGAGLGGGSADGAFTLQLLDRYFTLGLSLEQLAAYALQLGSDCPFFMYNQPCFAKGRGEKTEPIALDLSGWQFLLVHPGIHISTGWAFSQITPQQPLRNAAGIIREPVEDWKDVLLNDFEIPVFEKYPAIRLIKEKLYETGAAYASMTGSGSTVFGMFPKKTTLPTAAFQDYAVTIAT